MTTTVTIPVSLGGTNTAYTDGTGAYGMRSNNGYGYATYLMPMLSEVMAACQVAVNSGTAASTSATSAEASRDAIDNRIYPGTYSSDPTTRPDGSAIQSGDIYFTTGNVPKSYGSGVWSQIAGASAADLASTDPTKGTALVGTVAGALKTVLSANNLAGSATNSPSGALAALKDALRDDFHAAVNIRLVGDSITWGMTATGNGSQTPRSHALTDVRDVLTSSSWANKFRDYLGKAYATSALVDSGNGVGSYTKTVKVSMESDRLTVRDRAGVEQLKNLTTNASNIYGTHMDVSVVSTGVKVGLEFDFTGTSFTLYYSQLAATKDYELFVDGVSQGTFSTSGAATFNVTRTHTIAAGSHRIRIENTGTVIGDQVRLSGITWTKTIQVCNDGLIGTETTEWLSTGSILSSSIAASDEFVFVMLGTNDRASTTAPLTVAKTTDNLAAIANYLTGLGKKVILMAANAVTQSEAAFYYKQQDVSMGVAQVARDLRLDFIDHFRATDRYRQAGLTLLDDGLHPNDVGHELIFKNIVSAIESAPEYVAKQPTYKTLSGTMVEFFAIPPGTKRITVTISGMSTSGTSNPCLQIGDSGGIETSGYLGGASALPNGAATVTVNLTGAFLVCPSTAATSVIHATVILTLMNPSTNTWSCSVAGMLSDTATALVGAGTKSLSATLDRVRITTAGGTDTFDAGTANILFE